MKTESIDYRDGDTELQGYLALPDSVSGKIPAVMIAHAWAGRSDFENDIAETLTRIGYAGFAMDNFGKGVLGGSNEENQQLMMPFIEDRGMLRRRLLSGLDTLKKIEAVDTDRIAAIGFCFGGLCVLDLARSGADIKGVVSFHGLFDPPDNLPGARISAKVLALHGYDDPMVPPGKVQALADELTTAGVDWQIHAYGNTAHAFTHPDANAPRDGMAYSALMSRRAFASMEIFLGELFS